MNAKFVIVRGFDYWTLIPTVFPYIRTVRRTALIFSPQNEENVIRSNIIWNITWDDVKEKFSSLISYITEQLDCEVLNVFQVDTRCTTLVNSCSHYLLQLWENYADAPVKIEFVKNGEVICVMQSEFWHQIGGPAPYSDSYTFSFISVQSGVDNHVFATLQSWLRLGTLSYEIIIKKRCIPFSRLERFWCWLRQGVTRN